MRWSCAHHQRLPCAYDIVGPLREIPARDYIPQFSPDESRWARGLAAWDLLHGPRGRELIDKVNFWLLDGERLNSGCRLERTDHRRIPSPSPIDVIFQRASAMQDSPSTFRSFASSTRSSRKWVGRLTLPGRPCRSVGVGVWSSVRLVPVINALPATISSALFAPTEHLRGKPGHPPRSGSRSRADCQVSSATTKEWTPSVVSRSRRA